MKRTTYSRRDFVATSVVGTLAIASGFGFSKDNSVVSVVKIENENVENAVGKAIDLLGGIKKLTRNKKRIMLKPNLTLPVSMATTKPEVVKALAQLMLDANKEVIIGEGSAVASGFNVEGEEVFKTSKSEILDPMQQHVFDELGYTDLGRELNIPLINLHSGEMIDVQVPNGFMFDKITVHKSLKDIDMLCSVPMMKTHVLATVTLGMKNLIGLYPGTKYCAPRSCVHDQGSNNKSPGVAHEILDMVKACTPGLTVIDAWTSMEGNGPAEGELVKTNLIIAGTNPLATDMVATRIMGFNIDEIPTFTNAFESGMRPTNIDNIKIKGERLEDVQYHFKRPEMINWTDIAGFWGAKEI